MRVSQLGRALSPRALPGRNRAFAVKITDWYALPSSPTIRLPYRRPTIIYALRLLAR